MSVATAADVSRFERRVERERFARLEAEKLLESKSRELYRANQSLGELADHLAKQNEILAQEKQHAFDLARRDLLTGLLNRRAFLEALESALADRSRQSRPLIFALLDLDRFKQVNDAYGHQIADKALAAAADRLKEVVPGAQIGRWGGDEFTFFADCENPDEADRLLRRVTAAFQSEANVDNRPVPLGCTVGAALAPLHADNVVDLERVADAALCEAKKHARGAYLLFDEELRNTLIARRDLEVALREAVTSNTITPWFQPIFDINGARVASIEMLARWQAPGGSFVPPSAFIPMARELGLIEALDSNLADAGCAVAREWINMGALDSISLNVSPRDFADRGFVRRILKRLDETGLPPSGLVLELTEDAVFEDYEDAKVALNHLTAHGIRIALDDFGSGYSNLRALADLPLSTVKLDRSLVSEIETDLRSRTLVGAVIHLAKTLRLTVVAEGVENEMQALLLRVLGADRIQGYLYGKAMPVGEFHARFVEPALDVKRDIEAPPLRQLGRAVA